MDQTLRVEIVDDIERLRQHAPAWDALAAAALVPNVFCELLQVDEIAQTRLLIWLQEQGALQEPEAGVLEQRDPLGIQFPRLLGPHLVDRLREMTHDVSAARPFGDCSNPRSQSWLIRLSDLRPRLEEVRLAAASVGNLVWN